MKRLHDLGALLGGLGPGQSIVLHSACAEPKGLAGQLADSAHSLNGFQVHTLMPMGSSPYAREEPAAHLRINTFFPGRGLREAFNAGRVTSRRYPLSAIPGLFVRREFKADVLLLQVSPPDITGHVSLGISVDYMRAVLGTKPMVIAEIAPQMPSTCGDTLLPVSDIDYFVDADEGPQTVAPAETDPVDLVIAANVASLVGDGAILQIGIGSLPDMVLAKLSHLKHLGLHSGILTEAVRPLIESGAIDNSTKTSFAGVSVATMAAGTQSFYDFLHRNSSVEFHPCSLTHDRTALGNIRGLTAINSVLQVDLAGQANAEEAQGKRVALPGGLPDFAVGATQAAEGLSILALRSSYRNGQHSNIVSSLAPGTPVSVGADHVDYAVTEYGIARVRGASPAARAHGLIGIAHPAHRETLERQLRELSAPGVAP
jgi:4-hydroxybutyrate CoA-transferase